MKAEELLNLGEDEDGDRKFHVAHSKEILRRYSEKERGSLGVIGSIRVPPLESGMFQPGFLSNGLPTLLRAESGEKRRAKTRSELLVARKTGLKETIQAIQKNAGGDMYDEVETAAGNNRIRQLAVSHDRFSFRRK